MGRAKKIPSYRKHVTGQARVTIGGIDYYLGLYGSPESHAEYQRLIAEWLAGGQILPAAGRIRSDPDALTVGEACQRYLNWAEQRYRKNDKPSAQWWRIKTALKPLQELYSSVAASKFDRTCLETARACYVRAGHVPGQVPLLVGCVTRCWLWLVRQGVVPEQVYHSLKLLEPLPGQAKARRVRKVRPVPQASIDAIREHVLPEVWDMVCLQLWSGMRPESVRLISWDQIEQLPEVWEYRPRQHKTESLGYDLVIHLGAKCQAVLEKYRDVPAGEPIFSPRRAELARRSRLRKKRKAKLTPSAKARDQQAGVEHFGVCWSQQSYPRAVRRACLRAGVSPWHPHQLRHNAATLARSLFGPDAARAVLGHHSLDATEIYAELDLAKAREVAKRIG